MIIFIASFTKSTLLMENALGEMELNLLDVFGIIGEIQKLDIYKTLYQRVQSFSKKPGTFY